MKIKYSPTRPINDIRGLNWAVNDHNAFLATKVNGEVYQRLGDFLRSSRNTAREFIFNEFDL
jgi:hypothetical protein